MGPLLEGQWHGLEVPGTASLPALETVRIALDDAKLFEAFEARLHRGLPESRPLGELGDGVGDSTVAARADPENDDEPPLDGARADESEIRELPLLELPVGRPPSGRGITMRPKRL